MKQKAKHVISGEAEVLKALGRIREGRKVSVSYVQGGFPVATVRGRWVASDLPDTYGWMVFGSGGSMACIVATDRVIMWPGPSGTMHLRVDLHGGRMPVNGETIRRARIAGILPPPDNGGEE